MPLDYQALDPNFRGADPVDGLCYRPVRETGATVEGLCPGTWQRLPDAVLSRVDRPALGELARFTSGGVVRFSTGASRAAFRLRLSAPGSVMSHMPLCGSAGVDLFVDGAYRATFRPEPADEMVTGVAELNGARRELALYLPLYNGVAALELGTPPGGGIHAPMPHRVEQPVVFYGSSITQGGCATRTSTDYPALVTRWLDAELTCLGFSGNAKGDQAVAEYIAGLPMSCLVYDYDHNAPDAAFLRRTHLPFLQTILAARPEVPVLVLSRPNPDFLRPGSDDAERRDVVRETCERCRTAGYRVEFLDGAALFGTEDRECCTVDTTHPNDLGFYRMAKAVYPRLASLLAQP